MIYKHRTRALSAKGPQRLEGLKHELDFGFADGGDAIPVSLLLPGFFLLGPQKEPRICADHESE
jgi:hypothetical protein